MLKFYTQDEYDQKKKPGKLKFYTPNEYEATNKPAASPVKKHVNIYANNNPFDTGQTMKTLAETHSPIYTGKTPYDPVVKPGGIPVGMNIIQPYEEDSGIKKVGKGIVNYGLGTIGRIFGAPQQALMNVSANTSNAITGKPQDWREKDFTNDILEPSFPGAKNHPIVSSIVSTALDPTTYIGGGIVDDLAKTGSFGEAATKGTVKNAEFTAKKGQELFKTNVIAKDTPQAPTSQNKALFVDEYGNVMDDIKKKPLLLPAPAKQEPFTQVKYTTKREPNGPFKPSTDNTLLDTVRKDLGIKTTPGQIQRQTGADMINMSRGNLGLNSSKQVGKGQGYKRVIEPEQKPYVLENNNLIDQPFKATKSEIPKKPLAFPNKPLNKEEIRSLAKGENIAETQSVVKNLDSLKDDPVYDEISKNLEGTTTTADSHIQSIAPTVKDKSGLTLNLKDLPRNLRDAFGKHFEYVRQKYLVPFYGSKKAYVDEVKNYTDTLYNKVVKGLGITRRSKESAAVQWYGEGKMVTGYNKVVDPQTGKKIMQPIEVPYTKQDLIRDFGAEKANKIIEADRIFRNVYDELIDKVNAVRKQIYPNNPEKIIPKRKDYYRHFNEMAEGFEGLKNIFDTPANIDPKLAGISEFLKPRSKWASYMQKRGMGRYTADAVGGMLDYIQPAAYSIHIDPHINNFRQLTKDLIEGTTETKNANSTIKWLNDFANSLAGKTNKYDRLVQEDIPGGRAAFSAVNWFSNRAKANRVLLNARSAVSQLANVPVSVGRIKNPDALVKGVGQTLAGIAGKGNKAMKESQFISERYMNHLISRFDTKLINQPKKFAAWLLEGVDKLGTQFTWNSAYNKAVSKGIKNPVQYADDLTRSIVAGRGIGEVPLVQQSKIFQVLAPFQLEVTNLWHVFGDSVREKDFAGIALILAGNYIFNNITETMGVGRVTFDPVKAMIDAMSEEDKSPMSVAGRLAGEVLSNVPLGQTAASLYPEYGADITTPLGSVNLPTRKELFGRNDPTRFGGGLLVGKALMDPFYNLLPPVGGAQLKKTLEGNQAVNKGMVEKNGKMMFPVANNAENRIKGSLFGQYSFPEAKNYFDNNLTPLGTGQTKMMGAEGIDKKAFFDNNRLKLKLNKAETDQEKNTIKGQIIDSFLKTKDFTLFTDTINNTIEKTVNNKSIKKELTDSQYKEYISSIKKYTDSRVQDYVSMYKDYKLYAPEKQYEVFNKLVNLAITQAKNEMFLK